MPIPAPNASLFLAFSFSLNADGSAGSYNQKIASGLHHDINLAAESTDVFVAMQWEVYDALAEINNSTEGRQLNINKAHISPPPWLTSQDIDCQLLITQLQQRATLAQRLLSQRLDRIHPRWCSSEHLLSALNELLKDQYLFRLFQHCVELHGLHRPILGSVGSETRQLPLSADHPNGLAEFQTIRINRLILESVIPYPDALRRGEYLSTKGVLDFVLPQFNQHKDEISQVYIYGHPQHSSRCRRQTLSSLQQYGWDIGPAAVIDVHQGQQWPWDNTSAQVWCRDEQHWQDYEALVKKLLA